MAESWKNAFQSFQNMDLGGLQPDGAVMAKLPGAPKVQLSPARLQELQQQYLKDASELWSQGLEGAPVVKDRRFSAEAWGSNPMAAFSAATYLLNSRTLMGLAEAVEGDAKTKNRIRFAVEQWMAASAPSNFLALNAEAQKKAIDTKGESIAKGMQNLLNDIKQGHVSHDRREPVRGRPQRRHHRRRRGVRERTVPADRIQAADGQGVREAVPARAALHQQVLHPGPAARELA